MELTNVSKLGELHELITKNVQIEKDKPVYDPKFESPKYMDYHSQWKSPMWQTSNLILKIWIDLKNWKYLHL